MSGQLIQFPGNNPPPPKPKHEPGFDRKMDLNQTLIKNPTTTFYLKVTGDSMTGAGIYPDDLLIVERGADAKDGDIIVARLDGELFVKRLEIKGGEKWLASDNDKYLAYRVADHEEFEVWGRVTYSIHETVHRNVSDESSPTADEWPDVVGEEVN